jgi:hypothetical protein
MLPSKSCDSAFEGLLTRRPIATVEPDSAE